jgi:hypothetical protein
VGIWTYGEPPVTPEAELAVHHVMNGAELDRKISALRAHVSQTAGLVDAVGEADFHRWWSAESFVAARR